MLTIVWLVDPTWSPTEIWCVAGPTRERLQAIESIAARARFNEHCTGFPIPGSMLAMSPNCSRPSQQDPILDERVLWSTARFAAGQRFPTGHSVLNSV